MCEVYFNNESIKNGSIDLKKIDNKKISEKNLLKLLVYPPNASPLEIEYISGNETKNLTIKPSKELIVFRFKEIRSINKTLSMSENIKYFAK